MIKSMTGFGRFQSEDQVKTLTIEIRSVNHRFLDLNIKMPHKYNIIEDRIKSMVSKYASRGKIDLFISESKVDSDDVTVNVNEALALQYKNALKTLADATDIKSDFSAVDLASFPNVLVVKPCEIDSDSLWDIVSPILENALKAFVKSRETEGEKLKEDVLSRVVFIEEKVKSIEKLYPDTLILYRERLEQKIKETLNDIEVDTQRVMTEVAVFADKIAIDEEIVRLKSHLVQIKKLFEVNEPIGRKLDFIVQELNREINTIASKSQNLEISNIVIDVKAEIEKIREQIQNIE